MNTLLRLKKRGLNFIYNYLGMKTYINKQNLDFEAQLENFYKRLDLTGGGY